MKTRSISNVLTGLGVRASIPELPPPPYIHPQNVQGRPRIAFVVASMKNHTTDEGWQIMKGLEYGGDYTLVGNGVEVAFAGKKVDDADLTDIPKIVKLANPYTVVLQDKREWDTDPNDFRDPMARFYGTEYLSKCDDIFRVTILKDAHQRPSYHSSSANEMGCHAWIVYYNPQIVKSVASYVRPQHLIRTYHSIDSDIVPIYRAEGRDNCVLSGAMNQTVYPLRMRLREQRHTIPHLTWEKHPGYHRNGSNTPAYLKTLSRFKVAVCTSSIYGYAVRKIIEATACGCRVITDLPSEDVLPEIDGNIHRVRSDVSMAEMRDLIDSLISTYDGTTQYGYVFSTKRYYDYRVLGKKLAEDIEQMRISYNGPVKPQEHGFVPRT